MFFALKTDCYFRRYGDIGYISRPIIGMEEVVDECGSIFIEQLNYLPKSIDDLVNSIDDYFEGVDISTLRKDALSFYIQMADDGFLNKSELLCDFKCDGFDFSTLEGRLAYKNLPSLNDVSSEIYLGEYFKDKPYLQNFHIELTSKCNERCIHCYIPHEKKDTDIEFDLMMDVLDQCQQLGVMTLVFSGGEPMLHPNFCEFVKKAKDLDFNVTVLSNLTLLNDSIIEALKYKHIACVNVSLYSMQPEIHDSITTVKGSCEKTIKNILKLIENNIAVQINCPVMKQNKDTFQDVIIWGEEHKCSVVLDYVIMGRSDRSTDNLNNRLSKDELKSVIEKIAENSLSFKTNLKNTGVFSENKSVKSNGDKRVCGVGLSTMCMIANGNVYPCAGWQQYVCGNLNKISLKEIWENSEEINYLRRLRLKDFPKCMNCEDYDYCLMCMSRNYNESKGGSLFDIPQISCDAACAHHEIVKEHKDRMEM